MLMTGQMRAMKIRYKCCCIQPDRQDLLLLDTLAIPSYGTVYLCGSSSNTTFNSSTRYFLSLGITVVIAK